MNQTTQTLKQHALGAKIVALIAVFAILSQFFLPFMQHAGAASLTDSYIRLDRMRVSTSDINTLVVFTVPAGNAGTEDRVTVTFPSSTYITVGASPTVTSASCPAGTTSLPGTLAAASSGQAVTVTGVTNLSASTAYCFYISTGVSTTATPIPNSPVSAGVTTIETKSDAVTVVDSTSVGLKTISDDRVVVSATVPPYLQFALSGNSDNLSLDQGAIVNSSTPRTVTISTNGSKGWLAWVKSTNAGLTSAAASKTITSTGTINATPTTLTAGSEDFALDTNLTTDSATAGTGVVTIDAEYNGTGVNQGGTLTTGYNRIAFANGPTDGDVLTLVFRSTISALTPAANDYTDTVFVVGAGNF